MHLGARCGFENVGFTARKEVMLSRRMLIGSTAVLAAGCGGLDFSFPGLGAPQATPLVWVSRALPGFNAGPAISPPQEKLQRTVRELMANSESLSGPNHMRYILALRYEERYAGSYSDPNAEEFRKSERLAAWLEEVNADLVSLWPEEARSLGQQGVLLPLDQFGGRVWTQRRILLFGA